jgi:alkanesulfonate monooxygenase
MSAPGDSPDGSSSIPVGADSAEFGGDKGRRPAALSRLKLIPANFWAGIERVPRTAARALIGDPKRAAARGREYQTLRIQTFIASGNPHFEEAYRVAELLFPELGIGRANRLNHGAAPGEFGVGALEPAIVTE